MVEFKDWQIRVCKVCYDFYKTGSNDEVDYDPLKSWSRLYYIDIDYAEPKVMLRKIVQLVIEDVKEFKFSVEEFLDIKRVYAFNIFASGIGLEREVVLNGGYFYADGYGDRYILSLKIELGLIKNGKMIWQELFGL